MNKYVIFIGCLLVIFAIYFAMTLRKPAIIYSLQSYPELALADRSAWAQWRAEGQGIMRFLRHFLAYQQKSEEIVLNPFPGQNAFFATQKKILANLPQPSDSQIYVRVGFLGDLMTVPNVDEKFIAPEMLAFLQRMDFVLGNLETPISPSSSISSFRDSLSQFNTSPSYLNAISANGKPVFQFLSLANNHILDRGDLGVEETIQQVDARGILMHGATSTKFAHFSSKGIYFGVAAATWGVNSQIFQGQVKSPIWYLKGIAPLDKTNIDLALLKDSLAEMKKAGVDFKILFLHWGFEYEAFPDPAIQAIGRELIEEGADLIIGSHPHILQPFELVQTNGHRGLIAYSMGNFVTSMSNPFTRIGLIQELKIWRDEQNQIKWSLGVSRLSQCTEDEHPQVTFLGINPPKNLVKASDYYKQSLNLPFLQ